MKERRSIRATDRSRSGCFRLWLNEKQQILNFKMERTDDVIRCSVEKESIPKNPVNLKILLSTFEKSSPPQPTSLLRRGSGGGGEGGGGAGGVSDLVDHSQPSMAEVLTKFRQLERSGRRGRGGKRRSSSVDRVQGRRSSVDFWADDQLDGGSPPPSQTTTLIALFSQMERKKKGAWRRSLALEPRSLTKTEMGQRQAANRNSREVSMTFQGHPIRHETEEMVEMPEEGLVQTLLTQWMALEKPNAKKKKTWTPPQSDTQQQQQQQQQRQGQTMTPNAFSCNISTTPKTTVASKNIAATPQKTFHQTASAAVVGTKTNAGNGSNSQTAKGRFNDVTRPETGREGGGGRGGREEQAEEISVPLEGITRNVTEKFRSMEMKNTNSSKALPRSKSFKWEVKESSQIRGRSATNGFNRMDSHQPGLTFDLAKTLTPPSSPDFDHFDLQRKTEFFSSRQPDIVEQSNRKSEAWKEEFPLPCQTKNLLQRYEALLAHN